MIFSLTVIKTEFHEHKSWFMGWVISTFVMSALMVLIYPGEDGMKHMLNLLEEPAFQAVLGTIPSDNPSYVIWNSILSAFVNLIFLIYALLSGVKVSMKSITDYTGEIIDSLPLTRFQFLLNRTLVLFLYGVLLDLAWYLPLAIPIWGNYVEIDILIKVFWWGLLFILMGIVLGVLIGNLLGSTATGQQNSIILVLGLYIMQILINLQKVNLSKTEFWTYTDTISVPTNSGTMEVEKEVTYTLFNLITDINMINWYTPSGVMLGADISTKYLVINGVCTALFAILAIFTYQNKDLINERGFLNLRRGKKTQLHEEGRNDDQEHVRAKRSVKKSIYTFWAYPLQKRFPFAADIIYSDRRALLILAMAILMIYPMQLLAYLGDVGAETAKSSFGTGGLFSVFTYGYDLTNYPPWLWWISTQAVGVSWIFMLPMSIRWIRSVPSRDGEDGTGDLIGSLPIKKRDIVFQRMLGVFLEMFWTCLWLIFWYVLSVAYIESKVGSVAVAADPAKGIEEEIYTFNNPVSTFWVIVAILGIIPLYMFIVSSGVFINLAMKERGLTLAKVYVYILVLLFIMAFASGDPDLFWVSGIMGMYNPVSIMIEESLSPASYGYLWLILLTTIAMILVRFSTRHFSWLKQDRKEFYDE